MRCMKRSRASELESSNPLQVCSYQTREKANSIGTVSGSDDLFDFFLSIALLLLLAMLLPRCCFGAIAWALLPLLSFSCSFHTCSLCHLRSHCSSRFLPSYAASVSHLPFSYPSGEISKHHMWCLDVVERSSTLVLGKSS